MGGIIIKRLTSLGSCWFFFRVEHLQKEFSYAAAIFFPTLQTSAEM